ncbi:hypothetical protein ABZ234_08280 [Nocardiopsis sp. NPDC006198]|uniref:hypothetical protein n=1 Tax=Nocardiopsis sp. NPDC006198 TaxID=3154472 RepID=UPI0033BEBF4B
MAHIKIRLRGQEEDVAAFIAAIRRGEPVDLTPDPPAQRTGFVDVYAVATVPEKTRPPREVEGGPGLEEPGHG